VPPWTIAAGRVGSTVRPVASRPGLLQRPDCQWDCHHDSWSIGGSGTRGGEPLDDRQH
jgi:hypothetical protein